MLRLSRSLGKTGLGLFRSSVPARSSSSENIHPLVKQAAMSPVTGDRLPIVDLLASIAKKTTPSLETTAFFGLNHILGTMVPVWRHIIDLGANPDAITVLGKFYSTSPRAQKELKDLGIARVSSGMLPRMPTNYEYDFRQVYLTQEWESFLERLARLNYERKKADLKLIDKVFVMDEGGHARKTVPTALFTDLDLMANTDKTMRVAFSELTRRGMEVAGADVLPVPTIDIATCAAKRLEARAIAERCVDNALQVVHSRKESIAGSNVGILGNGVIGQALLKELLELGANVHTYDPDDNAYKGTYSPRVFRHASAKNVVNLSEVVFGCTGEDSIDFPVAELERDLMFISCSSEFAEFATVMEQFGVCVSPRRPVETYVVNTNRNCRVVLHPTPVNFTGSYHSVDPVLIESTRALQFFVMALQMPRVAKALERGGIKNMADCCSVDPRGQALIARAITYRWLHNPDLLDKIVEAGLMKNVLNFQESFSDWGWIDRISKTRGSRSPSIPCRSLREAFEEYLPAMINYPHEHEATCDNIPSLTR